MIVPERGGGEVERQREGHCYECNALFPEEDMVCFAGSCVCSGCKPVFFQRVKEGLDVTEGLGLALLGERFVAKLVDGAFLMIAYLALWVFGISLASLSGSEGASSVVFSVATSIIQLVIPAVYSIYFVARYGATPGKMVMKIRIVTDTGQSISWVRSTGRYFAEMISLSTFGIGYLLAFLDEERRALHDRICGTRVIHL